MTAETPILNEQNKVAVQRVQKTSMLVLCITNIKYIKEQ